MYIYIYVCIYIYKEQTDSECPWMFPEGPGSVPCSPQIMLIRILLLIIIVIRNTNNGSPINPMLEAADQAIGLMVPCAPKWFDFKCPILKPTKLFSRNSIRYLSNPNLPTAVHLYLQGIFKGEPET